MTINNYQENFIYSDNDGNAQIDWDSMENVHLCNGDCMKNEVEDRGDIGDYCLRHQMSKCTECKGVQNG